MGVFTTIVVALATIADSFARLWPMLARELQAARDRANQRTADAAKARAEANAADLRALAEQAKADTATAETERARVASERADAPTGL